MGLRATTKVYPDVSVDIFTDIESGITVSKLFSIKKNEKQVRDNLTLMCLKYDLQCVDCTKAWNEQNKILCRLRTFDNISLFVDYVKNKSNKNAYSFRIKGKFALTKIGDKTYIYRITPNVTIS